MQKSTAETFADLLRIQRICLLRCPVKEVSVNHTFYKRANVLPSKFTCMFYKGCATERKS